MCARPAKPPASPETQTPDSHFEPVEQSASVKQSELARPVELPLDAFPPPSATSISAEQPTAKHNKSPVNRIRAFLVIPRSSSLAHGRRNPSRSFARARCQAGSQRGKEQALRVLAREAGHGVPGRVGVALGEERLHAQGLPL